MLSVSPRISVKDWTLDTLPDRIAEVRQLYVDTLADWPVDELPKVSLYRQPNKAARTKTRRRPASKPAKAAPAKAVKAVKKAQPKTPASKVTKAQPRAP